MLVPIIQLSLEARKKTSQMRKKSTSQPSAHCTLHMAYCHVATLAKQISSVSSLMHLVLYLKRSLALPLCWRFRGVYVMEGYRASLLPVDFFFSLKIDKFNTEISPKSFSKVFGRGLFIFLSQAEKPGISWKIALLETKFARRETGMMV